MTTLAIDIDGVLTQNKFDFNFSTEKLLTTPILEGAQEALKKLEGFYTIRIVTSRPESVEKETKLWIKKSLGFKTVTFVAEKFPGNTGGDILIDDNLANIEKFIAHKGSGILLLRDWSLGKDYEDISDFLKNMPENLRKAGEDKKFFIAGSWKGVLELIGKVKV
jgi:hypothetical protein